VEIGAVYNGSCKPQSFQKQKDNYSTEYIEISFAYKVHFCYWYAFLCRYAERRKRAPVYDTIGLNSLKYSLIAHRQYPLYTWFHVNLPSYKEATTRTVTLDLANKTIEKA